MMKSLGIVFSDYKSIADLLTFHMLGLGSSS